jgi:2-dehydropantoate 2-reductase
MRFVVYGAGAVGGVIGARLFQHGHDVTFVARGAHLEALREHGLRLYTPDESRTLRVPATGRLPELHSGDVVLLTMKSQDTAAALADLAAVSPSGIAVACAQNGVANERLALRLFPDVYAVCVQLPATFVEPGVVEANMAPVTGILDLGRYPGGVDETAHAIAAAFAESGFESTATPDVMRLKYGKLLTNLRNATEAVFGPGNGDERVEHVARLARGEGVACLRAAGVEAADRVSVLSQVRPVRGRDRVGGSTYQSLRRGTGTIESDYLNGEIVLLGRLHGVPTPVNELLRSLAGRMAREGHPAGLMTPEEFLTLLDDVS